MKISSYLICTLILLISCKKSINTSALSGGITSITVSPSDHVLEPWQSVTLSATAFDDEGKKIDADQFTWTSSDSSVASVDPKGVVNGNLFGSVTISASSKGITGKATITVNTNKPILISPNIILDASRASSETAISINPTNPLNIVVSANSVNFCSFDGGRSWESRDIKYGTMDAWADPNVAFLEDGVLLRQGLNVQPNGYRGICLSKSFQSGKSFVSEWIYKPAAGTGNPDQGIITVDNSPTSKFKGSAYVIASDYPDLSSPSYPRIGFSLIVLSSNRSGSFWSQPVDISTCPNCGQEASSYITTGPNGEVYAAWGSAGHIVFNRSLDGGKTWDNEHTIGNTYGDYYRTPIIGEVRGNFTIDVDRSNGPNRGTIYISSIDVNGPLGDGAVAWMIRSTDGGNTWSDKVLISDGPIGAYKYYYQPRISVSPNGRIDAIWYDSRNWIYSNSSSTYDVYYSNSMDGGKTFRPSVKISTNSWEWINSTNRQIYEYLGLTSDSSRALAVWSALNNRIAQATFASIWIKQ